MLIQHMGSSVGLPMVTFLFMCELFVLLMRTWLLCLTYNVNIAKQHQN